MRYQIETVDRTGTIRTFICDYNDEIDLIAFYKAFDDNNTIRIKTIQGAHVFINCISISHFSIVSVPSLTPEVPKE